MTIVQIPPELVSAAIKADLDTISNFGVHFGTVGDSDSNAKTIGAPLPYILVHMGTSFPDSPRMAGRSGKALTMRVEHVAATEDMARSVVLGTRGFLHRRVVTADDGTAWRIWCDDSADVPVEVDQTWTKPDGGPLFSGIDTYTVTRA
ncbi:MAG TPA: hypothetical protein VFH56_10935 [Acidimicrobiales bacterium]|nr:hypothetical protein [Acidimicrobiales bacterium]